MNPKTPYQKMRENREKAARREAIRQGVEAHEKEDSVHFSFGAPDLMPASPNWMHSAYVPWQNQR